MYQVEMVCLDQMVEENHRYRGFMKVSDFKAVDKS